MKKALVFLLLACMLLCAAVTSVMADPVIEESLIYEINHIDSYAIVAGYLGTPGHVYLPQTYQGMPVIGIGDSAFENCTSLQSITIPEGVTSIGERAFRGCTSLQSITLPNSVTRVAGFAFCGCTSLQSITIPDGVTLISDSAFWSCTSLQSITFPNSVTSIGEEAFSFCTSLQNIALPNSVTSIGEEAFVFCTSLQSITIPRSVTSIGSTAFQSCSSLTTIIFEGNTPPSIHPLWLKDSAVESISVPARSVSAYQKAVGSEHAAKVVARYDFSVPIPDEGVSLRIVTTEFTSAQYSKLAPEVKKKGAEALAVPATQIKMHLRDWRLEQEFEGKWEEVDLKSFIADYPEAYPYGMFPISVPLPDAAVGKDVAVIHYVDGAWKTETTTVNGGQLTTYMDSLSPVAIVWAEDETVNLPQTGDDSNVMLWSALAFISLIGMTMLVRKRKEA